MILAATVCTAGALTGDADNAEGGGSAVVCPTGSPPVGTLDRTIDHDGLTREYTLYVPSSYTGDTPMPVVFVFHGTGGTGAEYHLYLYGFRTIADTAGFVLVYPTALVSPLGQTRWAYQPSDWDITSTPGEPDDLGFTAAIIDALASEYCIDETRVYATGLSAGGIFTYYLSTELSDRIAAIAPIAGTLTNTMYSQASPQHPTPVFEIHGTDDPPNLVPYNGSIWGLSVEEALDYWVGFNDCNSTPTITTLPDLDPTDGSTTEHHVWTGCDSGVAVEHFKVINGGHTWFGDPPGWPPPGSGGSNCYDFNGLQVIWDFFSRYDINGAIGMIFDDGFESGGVTAWSASRP